MDIIALIKQQIASNSVLLYMKGTPQFPMCGYSARVANALKQLNTVFSYVNVIEQQDIRATLPSIANWPTFPQLYINGELVGGCDIVTGMYASGELLQMLQAAGAIADNSEFQAAANS